jgi:anti-sigma factor RsiW
MNCEEVASLLTAEVDGEVDGLRSHAVRKHLGDCPACSAKQSALLDLRRRLGAELPRHRAPEALRSRILAAVSAPPRRHDRRWRWFGGGALAGGLGACLVWAMGLGLVHGPMGRDLSDHIVGLHTRATLDNRLIEIASSDRHSVKPWLSARLDYTIPVADWAQVGFPLAGARIDRLDGRPVATLIYRHRLHFIGVFVRPAGSPNTVPELHPVRGFNTAAAQGGEMEWLAASDLNGAELKAFVQGLARGSVTAASE